MNPSLRLPQPREVWSVFDKDVKLHDNERMDKGSRFVLVVMKKDLIIDHTSIFNIVPLSASAKPDRLSFPITQGYEDLEQGFKPKTTSCAIVNFYQPFEYPSFRSYCGRIEENAYEAIKTILANEVVGFKDFDYGV